MKTFARHKRASFDFELGKEYEAGIALRGFEVKAIRRGAAKLEGAHVVVRGGEAFLVGADIPPFQPSNTPPDYDPGRARRLLLSKKEIRETAALEARKGYTLIPTRLYEKSGKIKLAFSGARGKKQYDKRETLKKKEVAREVARALKHEAGRKAR